MTCTRGGHVLGGHMNPHCVRCHVTLMAIAANPTRPCAGQTPAAPPSTLPAPVPRTLPAQVPRIRPAQEIRS